MVLGVAHLLDAEAYARMFASPLFARPACARSQRIAASNRRIMLASLARASCASVWGGAQPIATMKATEIEMGDISVEISSDIDTSSRPVW